MGRPAVEETFDRAVMVAQWFDLQLETRETRVRTLSWASSGDYPIDVSATPTLPDANLRHQEALDWRKWTKAGCSFKLSRLCLTFLVMTSSNGRGFPEHPQPPLAARRAGHGQGNGHVIFKIDSDSAEKTTSC